jgi:hypothetical protein
MILSVTARAKHKDTQEEIPMMTTHDIKVAQGPISIVYSVLIVMTVLSGVLLPFQVTVPLMAEDQCGEQGITVRNATMLDLWYRKNAGECSIWTHEHRFTITPGDSIEIFSDKNCQTLYCTNNPTYRDYKSVDTNGDCFVNIFPNCSISDK